MADQNLKFAITARDLTGNVFRKLNASLGLVRRSLLNMKVGLTAVAGAAGVGLLVKSSLRSIDTLGKTASKLGVTTAELQKLRFASQQAGVETRTVDMAIQRFTRRLAEAAQETGEAKDALKELGLDARKLSVMPLEKQMLALADAFENVENSGDRVRLAFKLFDSEGVAFVNTLQGGSDALQQMFTDAESLGFILSANAVKGVEDANDSLGKLGTVLKGLADQMTAALAPALRVIVDLITNKIVQGIKETGGIREFARQLALSVVDLAENISKAISGFVTKVVRGLNFIIDAARALGRIIDSDTLQSLERVNNFASVGAGFFQDLRNAINGATTANNDFSNSVAANAEAVTSGSKALKDYADAALDVQKNLEQAEVRGLRKIEDSLMSVMDGTMSVKDAFKSMAASIIKDLIRIQIQKTITGPLAQASGGGGGGGFFSNIFAGFFANGGKIPSGKVGVVGEAGPELVSGPANVTPMNGGGGVTVNQTINLSTGVSQTVRAEVMNMLPSIQESTKAAVIEARRRGGSFAAAFGG